MPPKIEDYGLIGNCQTAALVSRDGSVDWLCLPQFDAAACFAALLGTPDNGRWQIAPADPSTAHRHDNTGTAPSTLETTFETEQGTATVIDFMPLSDGTSRPRAFSLSASMADSISAPSS